MPAPRLTRDVAFRRLWTAQGISVFGSEISAFAVPLLAVLVLDASAFEIGLLAAAAFLPFVLIGLPTGVWVDRRTRRPILVAADLVRAVLLATIPIAGLSGTLSMAQLLVVSLGTGLATVFFDTAYQAYLPSIVHRDQLLAGNARLEGTRSAAEVAGPGLAGLAVQALSAPIAVALDALSFLTSALLIVSIRRHESVEPSRGQTGVVAEIREGLRFVLGDGILVRLALVSALANLFRTAAGAVLVIFMVRHLGLGAAPIGVAFAVGQSGAVVGAVLAERLQRRLGIGASMLLAVSIAAAGFLLVPAATLALTVVAPVALLTAGLFFFSFGAIVWMIAQVTLRQTITPMRLQGRMNATMRTIGWGTVPVGALTGGLLGSVVGVVPTLWICGLGLALAVVPLVDGPIRRIRVLPEVSGAGAGGSGQPGTDATPGGVLAESSRPAGDRSLLGEPEGPGYEPMVGSR
jgi:MFS family permease